MSTDFLGGKAAEMAKTNPADAPTRSSRAGKRIPMSVPTLKLQVPEIPGYNTRWIRGTVGRLDQALKGGYEYVGRGELEVNQVGLANDSSSDGNTDLGDRVSIASGEEAEGGQTVRLFLMKIKQEFWDEDAAALAEQQEAIAKAIRGEGLRPEGQDHSHRYVPTRSTNSTIFHPKRRS